MIVDVKLSDAVFRMSRNAEIPFTLNLRSSFQKMSCHGSESEFGHKDTDIVRYLQLARYILNMHNIVLL